jgi:hypothetical protein
MKTIITAIIAFSVIGASAASAGNGRNGSSRNFDRPMRLGANFDQRTDARSSIAPTDARNARVLDSRALYAQIERERF